MFIEDFDPDKRASGETWSIYKKIIKKIAFSKKNGGFRANNSFDLLRVLLPNYILHNCKFTTSMIDYGFT